MKRITFITCLLLLSQMVFSQDLIDGYNVNEETKLIEFSEVIETNKEFKELSHLAFNWALGYKSDNNLKKTRRHLSLKRSSSSRSRARPAPTP